MPTRPFYFNPLSGGEAPAAGGAGETADLTWQWNGLDFKIHVTVV